jgi:hypothetical protein
MTAIDSNSTDNYLTDRAFEHSRTHIRMYIVELTNEFIRYYQYYHISFACPCRYVTSAHIAKRRFRFGHLIL